MSSISLVVASIAVLIVLLVSFGYLCISERKLFILIWFLSLLCMLLTYLSRLIMMTDVREQMFLLIINFASTICGYWLIYKGTILFLGKKDHAILTIIAALLVFTYILLLFFNYPSNVILWISAAYSSTALTITGFTALSASKLKDSIKYVLGCAFFLWAAATLIYPLYKILNLISLQYGYLFVGITGLITVLSIQAAYFISVREELLSSECKIKKLVLYDKLTGVYNRAHFEEIAADFFNRFPVPVALAMGDINGLKLINDTFGHKQGDELLVTAVRILKESVGDNNMIVRYGGDEFIIIMPHTSWTEAGKIVENIKQNCRSFRSSTIPIDISIGLSVAENQECSIDHILEQAEEKMYKSKLNESKQTRKDIIDFLQRLLWEKDYQTEEHVNRLKSMVLKIGKSIGLSKKENDELMQIALLHDIGKITVPVEILNKEGPLTPDEWTIMRRHSETGYRIAQASRELAYISEAILGHHEWWNGNGYPQGLKGEEIPLYSRIVSIVDSFDVMTHDRPYKQAISAIDALHEIIRCSGTQFDPSLVDIFVEMIQSDLKVYL
ncbi:MAG: HD-GYP domain-containing protein [Clostridiaceae bacterium]